jgi:hypothetical protein
LGDCVMVRPDISDKLVHFTSGTDLEGAYRRLCQIIDDSRLLGSGGTIRGGYRCICFSEAPLISLGSGLVNPNAYSRYSPFGIIFDKSRIFSLGGRPVIYQPDAEFAILPPQLQWRHMRYEPDGTRPIDFSWEREWRLCTEELALDPAHCAVVVPDSRWASRLVSEHAERQEWLVQKYSQVMDSLLAEQYREGFPWRIVPLA